MISEGRVLDAGDKRIDTLLDKMKDEYQERNMLIVSHGEGYRIIKTIYKELASNVGHLTSENCIRLSVRLLINGYAGVNNLCDSDHHLQHGSCQERS